MAALPSGLPDLVADEEDLARFLTQSNQFNALMAKPAAFLPNPKYRNTSVFRCGNDPERLRVIWQNTTNGQRPLKAAAIRETLIKARFPILAFWWAGMRPPGPNNAISGLG